MREKETYAHKMVWLHKPIVGLEDANGWQVSWGEVVIYLTEKEVQKVQAHLDAHEDYEVWDQKASELRLAAVDNPAVQFMLIGVEERLREIRRKRRSTNNTMRKEIREKHV